MATVDEIVEIPAAVGEVFAYVDDYSRAQEWMFGLSRLEPVGEQTHGVGAVFDGTMKLGVALKSRIECTRWQEDKLIEMTSVSGIRNTQRWEFIAVRDDLTRLRAHITYELPGGPAGRAMSAAVKPLVGVAVHHSTAALLGHFES